MQMKMQQKYEKKHERVKLNVKLIEMIKKTCLCEFCYISGGDIGGAEVVVLAIVGGAVRFA